MNPITTSLMLACIGGGLVAGYLVHFYLAAPFFAGQRDHRPVSRDGASAREAPGGAATSRIEPRRLLTISASLFFGTALLAASASVSSRANERVPPPNAHTSPYGGWDCSRGFSQVEGTCVAIRVPANAYLDSFGRGWDCNRGYVKDDQGLRCKAVRIPTNAHVDDEEDFGAGWECDRRYRKVSGGCTRVLVPANAYYSELSLDRAWECNPGYRREGDGCMAVPAPVHGFLVGDQDEWACDRGFKKSADSCVPVAVPANGYLDRSGNDWRCERGFKQEGAFCTRLAVPAGAYIDYTGNGWTCAEGLHEQGGACMGDR